MVEIYEQYDKAFQKVGAWAILDRDGEYVAKIAIKFPADGAGRLYAYVHWFGIRMERGYAGGYGYDKRSAAVADATRKAIKNYSGMVTEATAKDFRRATFFRVLMEDGGEYFYDKLRKADFTVIDVL